MNEGEVVKEPDKAPDETSTTQSKIDDKVEQYHQDKGGVNYTAAAGTIAQVAGNIALFTGLVGAAFIILAIIVDPMGLWAIPALLAGGLLANSLGRYLDHKSKGTEKEFVFFPRVFLQAA